MRSASKWIEVRMTKKRVIKNSFFWTKRHGNGNELCFSPGFDSMSNAKRAANNHNKELKIPLEIRVIK